MTNNEAIEKLIENSFKELLKIGEENAIKQNAESRLIFPKKRDGEKRVSEQELRFLLARELEKQKDFYYSVEVPTEDEFSFTGDYPLSARTDLCLYNSKGKKISLIELKYKNVNVKNDFLKLLCDSETEQNYFVQIVDNTNRGTIEKIEKKYQDALTYIPSTKIKSSVKIILFVISKQLSRKYKINKTGELSKLNK